MENQEEQRKYEFQKLTPFEKTDMKGYEQSLDFVFKKENSDLRNIALAGNYGSGKSSVIRTYAENHKDDLSFIYVSLAHFKGVSGETDEENYDVDVEKKIINHIVQQIPAKNVPDSGFRIKRNFNKGKGIWIALRIVVLICAIAYLNSWSTMHEMQNAGIWNWLTGSVITAIILLVGFVDGVSLIYSVVKGLNAGRKVKSLKFQNGSVEFDDQNEKSYFDQHLDEILYLFAEANVDAVVFEDIDRFKEIDLKVLEHLRELCTLANDRIRNIDSKRKPIRFFYLIGDHVFEEYTDRTKFFDYIIPVIPVVDASNSYAKMREFLEKSGDYEKLDDRFLRGLCLYLDDLRTVKNIVNEFQIYSGKLSGTAKDANQLLALITYKNVYPDDFSELQKENGYLHGVFSTKEEVTRSNIEDIQGEIEELRKRLTDIENEELTSIDELEAVHRERQNNPNRFKDGQSSSDWNNKVYPARKDLIKSKVDSQSQKVRAAIAKKQRDLTHIRSLHLYELIDGNNEAVVFGYKEDEPVREKNDNQLVEFFIKNGFIDETTYRDYIALFYEKGMSYRDKDFLISVNSHNGKPFDYELHDIGLVIENLGSDDFIEPETRNFSILDYILEHNKDEYVQKFVFQLQENTDYDFISQYLRVSKNKVLFIKALNKYWTESLVALISNENQVMTLEEVQNYIICSLAHIDADKLELQNKDELLTLYVVGKFSKATCDDTDCDAIGDSLATLGVKFTDLDQQLESGKLRSSVYTKDLYELNRTNVESILKTEYGLSEEDIKDRKLTVVFSDSEQALFEYADANINDLLADIVTDNEGIHDTPEIAVGILNRGDVDEELKKQYIGLLSEPFESLVGIDEKQWSTILTNEKVICNADEILRYFGKFGLTAELVEFINRFADYVDYAECENVATLDKFVDACLKNGNINDDRYRVVMQQVGKPLGAFRATGLGDSKVIILIEESLIQMNAQNLTFIRQNYPNEICSFVESDVDGYLGLINGNNFIVDEALQLIGDNKIDMISRQKIVDKIPNTISVRNHDYDDEIIKYILTKKYDANDIRYLIEHYEGYSGELQKIIYGKLKSPITTMKNNISAIAADKELLYRIFEDSDISVADKSASMDLLITDKESVDLEKLLQKMGFSNMTKLVSGDTSRLPQIKNGTDEIAILTVLKKHGYIEDFSADEDSDTIKVERKRSLFGGKHGR